MDVKEESNLAEGVYATDLHNAVKENSIPTIRGLLEKSIQVQAPDRIGRTPLHWSLVFGHDAASRVLIVHTSKRALDCRDAAGCSALHYAVAGGRVDMARILIERGANINATDCKRRTPLHYAAQHVKPDMVELLVSRGANRACVDAKGALPCDVAVKWGSFSAIACLRPDSKKLDNVNATDTVSEEKSRSDSDKPPRKGPSLDRLLGVWRTYERDACRKKEEALEVGRKATAKLNKALEAWREIQRNTKQGNIHVEVGSISSADQCSSIATQTDMEMTNTIILAQSLTDLGLGQSCEAATSSTVSPKDPPCLPVDTLCQGGLQNASVDQASAGCEPLNDLSWCTEWDKKLDEPIATLSPKCTTFSRQVAIEDQGPMWVQVWPLRNTETASSSSALEQKLNLVL